jgi:integrase
MAALQERAGSYRVIFRHNGKQQTFTIGNVPKDEAENKARQVAYLLMRLKQGLLIFPPDVDIVTFVKHDGKPPQSTAGVTITRHSTTLGQLRDKYVETFGNGTIESSTLYTRRIHFGHLVRILGEDVKLLDLTHERLQEYVNKRGAKTKRNGVGEVTIRKEIATLRAAWNWGSRSNLVTGALPNKGLRYPKSDEKPPFMTRAEIERQIALGGSESLWECLYLQLPETEELLNLVQVQATHPFIYPMFCMAAFTSARRSELLASQRADFDFSAGIVVIREKKRINGRKSTRRVPMTTRFAEVMKKWFDEHPGGAHTFAKVPLRRSRTKKPVGEPLTRTEAHDHFQRTLANTKWECVRGWHVLRHSFVSACASKGVDQRLVQEWAGHQSAEMSRRYAHLYPSTQQEALKLVFG